MQESSLRNDEFPPLICTVLVGCDFLVCLLDGGCVRYVRVTCGQTKETGRGRRRKFVGT